MTEQDLSPQGIAAQIVPKLLERMRKTCSGENVVFDKLHVAEVLEEALASALSEAKLTITHLQGAMAAQDEREQQAGDKCGVSALEYGCDWPDAVADRVLHLRAALSEAQQARDEAIGIAAGLKDVALGRVQSLDAIDSERRRVPAAQEETPLQQAVRAFLAKWELVLPAIQSAFLMQHIHGGRYDGPAIEKEIDVLKVLLLASSVGLPQERRTTTQEP